MVEGHVDWKQLFQDRLTLLPSLLERPTWIILPASRPNEFVLFRIETGETVEYIRLTEEGLANFDFEVTPIDEKRFPRVAVDKNGDSVGYGTGAECNLHDSFASAAYAVAMYTLPRPLRLWSRLPTHNVVLPSFHSVFQRLKT